MSELVQELANAMYLEVLKDRAMVVANLERLADRLMKRGETLEAIAFFDAALEISLGKHRGHRNGNVRSPLPH